MTLFGTLSLTLTFLLKMQTRLEVRNQLVAARLPPRTKEQLEKKWEGLSSATKTKYAKRKQTEGGAVEWPDVDELITEILGKENPSLTLGIKSKPVNTLLMLQVTPVRKPAYRQLHRTFQWAQIGWLNWKVARELQRTSKKKAVKGKSKQKNQTVPDSDTVHREQGRRERNMEKVYEEFLKEEHEVRMRILQKKEQLLDPKLQLLRRKLNIDE